MKYIVNRYSLTKDFISTGTLTITSQGQSTYLTYADATIEETVNELYHPLTALSSLRQILEAKHKSIINCTGCRIDSAYRPTGGYGTYIITYGKPGTERASLFEPTTEILKLCTLEEHKIAYKKWTDSIKEIK